MLIQEHAQSILEAPEKIIVFFMDDSGENAEFPGGKGISIPQLIADTHWSDLPLNEILPMGSVLRHEAKGKTFFALVCHGFGCGAFSGIGPRLTKMLSELPVPNDVPIALDAGDDYRKNRFEEVRDVTQKSPRPIQLYIHPANNS